MKARIATIASFAGVLVAGSAAAMVNSQVLHNTGVVKNSVQNVAPLTVDTGVAITNGEAPETVVVESTSPAATDGVDSTHPASAAPTTLPANGTRARYRIGDAGDVVLDTAHDRLTIAGTDSTDGWRVVSARSTDALNAVVTFQSATRRVVFHASLLFGVVGYSVTTYDLTGGGTVTTVGHQPPSSTSAPSTTEPATPSVTTSPSFPTSPPTTVHEHHWPGPTTTEPDHHHSGYPGGPSTTTPRWGSGNGEDD